MLCDQNNIANVDINTSKKTVWVYWEHYPNPPSSDVRTQVEQLYNVSYWPTSVSGNGGLNLFVGGRSFSGDTIIEKWTFDEPDVPPTVATNLPRTSVSVLYSGRLAGRNDVVELMPMINSQDHLLILFHDERELWRLTLSTSTWLKVASPSDPTVLMVPELSEKWPLVHVREHVNEGAFYTFGDPFKDNTITFVDSNTDAVLDLVMDLTTDEWHDRGYGDATNFVSVFPF